jgi:hypothetical protein
LEGGKIGTGADEWITRYEDERLLSVSSAVAKVWVGADKKKYLPSTAPEGVGHASA